MKKLLLLTTLLLCAAPLGATTISFNVDPAYIGPLLFFGFDASHTTGLNALTLEGQSMSIDGVFAGNVIAHMGFQNNEAPLYFVLDIRTDAATIPGLGGESSGFLIDQSGNQIGPSRVAALSNADNGHSLYSGNVNGHFLITLEPFSQADFGGSSELTISGVHFDVALPDTGYHIIDARLVLGYPGGNLMYQVARPLPELSSMALLPLGLLGIMMVRMRRTGFRGRADE